MRLKRRCNRCWSSQTALGGSAGDGTEIAGISSYFLEKGRAETAIASLWSVNDASTSVLMRRFYELLASGELSKAEALRQAQLSLLYDEDAETRLSAVRAGAPLTLRPGLKLPRLKAIAIRIIGHPSSSSATDCNLNTIACQIFLIALRSLCLCGAILTTAAQDRIQSDRPLAEFPVV